MARRVGLACRGAIAARGRSWVLAPTLSGLADGDDPTHHSLADVVDNVAGLIERHDLSDVVLVGHSWGAT